MLFHKSQSFIILTAHTYFHGRSLAGGELGHKNEELLAAFQHLNYANLTALYLKMLSV